MFETLIGLIESKLNTIPTETKARIKVDNTDYTAEPLADSEKQKVAKSIAYLINEDTPVGVKTLVLDNLDAIVGLIRIVKSQAGGVSFEGIDATGNSLTIKPLEKTDFTSIFGTAGDFKTVLTSTGPTDYIGTDSNPEVTDESTGIIILGLSERTPEIKYDAVQFKKNKVPKPAIVFSPDYIGPDNIIKFPKPLVVPPETSYQIKVDVIETGLVETYPIGFKICQAKSLPELF